MSRLFIVSFLALSLFLSGPAIPAGINNSAPAPLMDGIDCG
ncbi:hypothetical protein [Desulfitobacterium metallireducens]|uniref:Uncharacterized protein n=1 Tax=Desulfitobacterium metallireducens DSM 15288 TaxID=871968 RepID=W0ECA9_9FIRM|nr:hypothetical protein [Desulfitobacterium metallireducens]AHF08402.1 hypothetical protein DESME_01995 [Desulfitobacterium metallireducens DSM 15288]